jgi:hypothetical protein
VYLISSISAQIGPHPSSCCSHNSSSRRRPPA